jgi:fucose permease
LWGIGGVIAGAIADRLGAGRVMLAGLILIIVGYYILYAAQTSADLCFSLTSLDHSAVFGWPACSST